MRVKGASSSSLSGWFLLLSRDLWIKLNWWLSDLLWVSFLSPKHVKEKLLHDHAKKIKTYPPWPSDLKPMLFWPTVRCQWQKLWQLGREHGERKKQEVKQPPTLPVEVQRFPWARTDHNYPTPTGGPFWLWEETREGLGLAINIVRNAHLLELSWFSGII